MRFLLINTNPAVSKLVSASLNRIGHEAKEIGSYNDLPLDSFIAVIVDSDSYDASHIDDLLAVSIAPALVYLKQQDAPTPEGFQYALVKPFLPTDFITFIVSILKKHSELKRFITSEAEEFVSMLPEEGRVEAKEEKSIETPVLTPEEQVMENNFINFNFYDDLQKKAPIFDVQEQSEVIPTEPIDTAFKAPKIEPDIPDGAFFNLSDDISKFYSSDGEEIAEQSAVFTSGFSTEETAQDVKPQTPPPIIDDNIDSFVEPRNKDFVLDDVKIDKTTKESELPQKEQSNGKVDFDFNIMEDTPKPTEEIAAEGNFLKEPQEEVKKFGGFGELAKEFDDLIKPSKEETVPKEAKLPSYVSEPKTQSESKADPLESLNEKEVKRALQDGGLLPQSAEEMVKSEIQSVVQNSVQGLLQGNILREVLKGLKMNITITFEDKE
jgi:uncharacterized membrane protein